MISEIAWAGTQAYAGDEWIELYNPGSMDIDLSGWILVTDSGSVYIPLSGVLTAGSVYLLERGNDQVVSDIPADLIYTSNEFADGGETLRLLAPDRSEVDTANVGGGSWPAGNAASHASMERRRDPVTGEMIPDEQFTWITFDDATIYAHDAAGNVILGSPGFINWAFTVTPTFTPTVTPTPTSTPTPTPVPEQAVVINEVAWGGTKADSDDEWIELYNPGPTDIDLTGWRLASNDGSPNITLSGIIPADGFFLLERTDDDTVQDIPADLIYSGQLSNGGEVLTLYAPDNSIVDRANGNAGAWPAGSSYPDYASMERRKNPANGTILPDSDDTAWITNSGKVRNGLDADGNPINGTPRQPNWAFSVTPTPSPVPTHVPNPVVYATPAPVLVLNEFLPHPSSDWNNDGETNVYDEFVEVFNAGVVDVELDGWELDDEEDLDSDPYPLPDLRLRPGERAVFYRSETDIALSDAGDTVRLLDPYGEVADAYTYGPAPQADVSVCRLPDGRGPWTETCFPTPNRTNGVSGVYPPGKPHRIAAPLCLLPDTAPLPFRLGECGLAGEGTWNPTYWDDLAGGPPWVDQRGKWEVWGR
ncbi:MAG: lamin tail domain-containing protein [Anaerolineae bacterium]|nr:MAG: lamin tail domain-containing protein [Anaerolineae bacterium]